MSGGTIQIADNGDEWPFVAFQNPRKKLRVLDLFSGIGGFSLGLERTGGFETVAFCEIEAFPRKVLAKHWPDVPCYDDVRTLTAERLAADGIAVDVICGGFPCQDISCAGYKVGIGGEKSGLWTEFARLIDEIGPEYVGVENVGALLHRGLEVVLGDLAALGYDAEWHCIPASSLGAPHHRDRFWLVAHTNNKSKPTSAINDETCRLPQSGSSVFAHTKCGERPLGWLMAGIGGQWESVTRNAAWNREDSPIGLGVDDGLPDRMDRLKALGNAVVPQIPELIGNAILSALHLSPIPYRPEDEQDWRRSILSGIAFGPRYRASHRAASSVSPVPASIANAGDK